MISTIVLSWNRAELLEQTLRSFAETAVEPFELFVVDNASSDRSREVIEESRRLIPALQTIYNEENLGGEALNAAIAMAAGAMIHINENDIALLPGWREHVADAFRAFPDLGQLSLFSGVPADDYPGEPQPVSLRFAAGTIVYEAHGNVGSSSILRTALFRAHGVRVHNLLQRDPNAFAFPDDGRLSADVKAAGYWCAWSDRRYVRDLGNNPEEFDRDPDYYRRNYTSKPWIGVSGFSERLAAARRQPRPRRYSSALPQLDAGPERTAGTCAGLPARLWSSVDAVTPEVEVLDFLHALVRLVKPRRALDAGAWLGWSAVAIGSALRDNGFGTLAMLAAAGDAAAHATATIASAELSDLVAPCGPAPKPAASEPFDFAFFASRSGDEFVQWYDGLADGATVVLHGPVRDAPGAASFVDAVSSAGLLEGFAPATPRGLFVGRLAKPPDGLLRRVPEHFDPPAYLAANPDVARAGVEPAEHYRRSGWRERRTLGIAGGERDSYERWRASYAGPHDWDTSYRRGHWDYLDGVGEVPRYALVAGYVRKLLPHGDVLDAGCGDAILGLYLDPASFRYTGIDVSLVAVERARSRLRHGTVLVSPIESFDPPVGVRYGAVIFGESVQHTSTPLESIDRYREFLAPGGFIVVSLCKDHRGRGPRLAALLAAACDEGRYSLIHRSEAISVAQRLAWDIFVLR